MSESVLRDGVISYQKGRRIAIFNYKFSHPSKGKEVKILPLGPGESVVATPPNLPIPATVPERVLFSL